MLGSVSSSLYGLALSDLGGISKPHIIIIIIIFEKQFDAEV